VICLRYGLFGLFLLVPMLFVFAAPWDFLRPVYEFAAVFTFLFVWLLAIVSIVLLLISIKALRKKHSRRLLLVSGAFGLFALKSVLNLVDFYFSPGFFMNFSVQGLFDLLIILALFIALFKE
jgi:hypothetical protein